jgi:hypothetical protein
MEFPRFARMRQHFTGPKVADIDAAMKEQLAAIDFGKLVAPGMKIAITAGSRGVARINEIIRALVNEIKGYGGEPYIVPAMGSHGGATAEGQVEVLEGLGVTEAFCGAPILSSMEVDEIGRTEEGLPVYCDRIARSMDGIIVMNRVKVHTDFSSPLGIESGVMKMAAIGLGKHKTALLLHSYGVHGIRDLMPKVAEVTLREANILCGIAIVENAFEETAAIEAIPTQRIFEREQELLKFSASLMPKLPVSELDLLVVDEIGKNYSGTGMDTNIIGRMRIAGVEEPADPKIRYILARDLSEASHGNALGIGLADLTTRRLFHKIDFRITNENVITSTFLHRAMIPIVLDSDRLAMLAAYRGTWGVEPKDWRILRIANTLHLQDFWASEALLPELIAQPQIEQLSAPEPLAFDEAGDLPPLMPLTKG